MRVLQRIGLGIAALLALSFIGMVTYAYWPYEEVPVEQLAGDADRFATVSGERLRYRQYPAQLDPEAPTLVFLHGFFNSLHSWRKVAPALAEDANVLAVDLLGFGLSAHPPDADYGYQAQADRVGALVRQLGLSSYIPVGHSYGGTVAASAALSDPAVPAVVLVDPGILATGVPTFVRYLTWPVTRVSARMFARFGFRKRLVHKSLEDTSNVTDDDVRQLMIATRAEGYMEGRTALFGRYVEVDVDRLLQIPKPTLLIWGEKDHNNPIRNAHEMKAALPDASLVIVEGAAHYPHEEQPEKVIAALRAFLAELKQEPSDAP